MKSEEWRMENVRHACLRAHNFCYTFFDNKTLKRWKY